MRLSLFGSTGALDHWAACNSMPAPGAGPGLQKELELEYGHHGGSRQAPHEYGFCFSADNAVEAVHRVSGTGQATTRVQCNSFLLPPQVYRELLKLQDTYEPQHSFMQLPWSTTHSASTATCTGTGLPLRGSPTLMSRVSSSAPWCQHLCWPSCLCSW